MSSELLYTSAPKGLRQGSRGFCTVISSTGMPSNLSSKLESLSGYRQMYAPDSADADKNPIALSHLTFSLGGQTTSVLSRVTAFGTDYSGRTNKLAHHVVPERTEHSPAGPAWVLQQAGVMRANWNGECQTTATGPNIPTGQLTPAQCQTWQRLAGDAGWAGVLAEAWTQRQGKPIWIVFPVEQQASLLPLLVEATALLPEQQRWNATFSTYATQLPPDIECRVRCVVDGTQDARMATARGTVIQLGQANPSPPPSNWVEIARGNQVATTIQATPAAPTPTLPVTTSGTGAAVPTSVTPTAPAANTSAIPATPEFHAGGAPPQIPTDPHAVSTLPPAVPDLPLQMQDPLDHVGSNLYLDTPESSQTQTFAYASAYKRGPIRTFAFIGVTIAALMIVVPASYWYFNRPVPPPIAENNQQGKGDNRKNVNAEDKNGGTANDLESERPTKDDEKPPHTVPRKVAPSKLEPEVTPQPPKIKIRDDSKPKKSYEEGSDKVVEFTLSRTGGNTNETLEIELRYDEARIEKNESQVLTFAAKEKDLSITLNLKNDEVVRNRKAEVKVEPRDGSKTAFESFPILFDIIDDDFSFTKEDVLKLVEDKHLNDSKDEIKIKEGDSFEIPLQTFIEQNIKVECELIHVGDNNDPPSLSVVKLEKEEKTVKYKIKAEKTEDLYSEKQLTRTIKFSLKHEEHGTHEVRVVANITDTTPEKTELVWKNAREMDKDMKPSDLKGSTWWYYDESSGYHPWEKRTSLPAIKIETNNRLLDDTNFTFTVKPDTFAFNPNKIENLNTNPTLRGPVNDRFQTIEVTAKNTKGKTVAATLVFRNPTVSHKIQVPEDGWAASLPFNAWYKRSTSGALRVKDFECNIEISNEFDIADFRATDLNVMLESPERNQPEKLRHKNLKTRPEVYFFEKDIDNSNGSVTSVTFTVSNDNLKIAMGHNEESCDLKTWFNAAKTLKSQIDKYAKKPPPKQIKPPELPRDIADVHEELNQRIIDAKNLLEDPTDTKLTGILDKLLEQKFKKDSIPNNYRKTKPPKPKEEEEKKWEQYQRQLELYEKYNTLDNFLKEFRDLVIELREATVEIEQKELVDPKRKIVVKRDTTTLLETELKHHFEFR